MDNANARNQGMNFDQIFDQAERSLRQGLETLTEWGDQARDILSNRPGVVLASLSIAGFMTGLLLRRGDPLFRRGRLAADPTIVFLTGALAGVTLGPRILREAAQGMAQRMSESERSTVANFDRPASERAASPTDP